MRIIVYVEGGGRHHRKTLDDCRRGFGQLFEKVVLDGHQPKVIPCADRRSTYLDFRAKIETGEDAFLILLVDSEEPVGHGLTSWDHLQLRDRWRQPARARNDQAHLMVECMESWLLSDRQILADYYGQGFLVNALPGRANIEEVPKRDVEQKLEHATSRT